MKIVIGGIKGGSGKTTIATNLCVIRASLGFKVLLIDADEQKSSYDWASQREDRGIKTTWSTVQLSGVTIHSQLNRLSQDYDDVIIDVGGRDTTSQRSALSCADVFIIPFKPRSLDIWTLGAVKAMVEEISVINPKLLTFAIINQADFKGSDNADAMEIITKNSKIICLSGSIGNRKAFANAASEGLGVVEMKNKDFKAVEEMNFVYEQIFLAKYICHI